MDDTRFRSDRGGDQPYPAEEEYQDSDVPNYAAEEHYQDDEVPRARRNGLALVVAIIGLALVGSACAVGYRNIFVGSVSPTLPPAIKAINTTASVSEPPAESSGNARQIGPATTGSVGTMASREAQPATIERPKAAPGASLPRASVPATPAAGQAVPTQAVPRVLGAERPAAPARIAAAPQRAGQADADVTAASNHEHLAAVPVAHANVDSGAAVGAPFVASGYAVQVTSEHSESRAQAAFRALQAKYPNQLSGHQPIIRRADLGSVGIYYRALVGPFASAEKAAKMCSRLKAAGGDCILMQQDLGLKQQVRGAVPKSARAAKSHFCSMRY
jgi:hypothetical protein